MISQLQADPVCGISHRFISRMSFPAAESAPVFPARIQPHGLRAAWFLTLLRQSAEATVELIRALHHYVAARDRTLPTRPSRCSANTTLSACYDSLIFVNESPGRLPLFKPSVEINSR